MSKFNGEAYSAAAQELNNELDESTYHLDEVEGRLVRGGIVTEEYANKVRESAEAHRGMVNSTAQAVMSADTFADRLAKVGTNVSSFATSLSSAVRLISQVTALINGGMRISEILQDKDLKP